MRCIYALSSYQAPRSREGYDSLLSRDGHCPFPLARLPTLRLQIRQRRYRVALEVDHCFLAERRSGCGCLSTDFALVFVFMLGRRRRRRAGFDLARFELGVIKAVVLGEQCELERTSRQLSTFDLPSD